MIAKIEGLLEAVVDDRAIVKMPGGLTLEVLLAVFTAARLHGSIGQPVTLHTLLFLEQQSQGLLILPRLAGFLTPEDRAFYQLFVTAKGIGYRRALRAMALPTAQLASAIADRDLALLQSLPEIGRRTAETIVVALKDKVDRFVSAAHYPPGAGAPADAGAAGNSRGSLAREALEVLLQLGENRAQAVQWIDEALAQSDPPRDVQTLIAEVYRIKAGVS
ncbi:MAG TPA: Holliday junction branch migration protein RuvA [Phycisphaeraceae bacterium]